MKKTTIDSFCTEIEISLEAFKKDMISRKFSNRNNKEWFKMLGDYLDFNEDLVEDVDYADEEKPEISDFLDDEEFEATERQSKVRSANSFRDY
jgi:hypothetical protein